MFVALFFLYLATATFDQQQNIDTLSTLVPAWQLASQGDVYADQYAGFSPWFVVHEDHVVNNRLPGAILWATPFYALLGRGGDYAPVYPAAVASAAATALAVGAVFVALRRLAGWRAGLAAALVLALATPTWSVSADALWTHGPAQLFLACSLVFFSTGRLAAAGLAQAAAILVRPHLAVVPACMGIAVAVQRRSVRPLLTVGLTSALGVVALLLYYRLVYDRWTFSGGYGALGGYGTEPGLSSVGERLDGTSEFWANVAQAVASPARGLLVYSPFLLLLLPGLRAAWVYAPIWVRSAAVSGVVYGTVQLWNNGYSGEDFFGYRLLLEPLTLWTPLLTLAYLQWTRRHARVTVLFWAVVSVAVAWQAAAAVSNVGVSGLPDPWRSTGYEAVWREQPELLIVLLTGFAVAFLAWWRAARHSFGTLSGAGAAASATDPTARPTASPARPDVDPLLPAEPPDRDR